LFLPALGDDIFASIGGGIFNRIWPFGQSTEYVNGFWLISQNEAVKIAEMAGQKL
jgi:hypothetical protein